MIQGCYNLLNDILNNKPFVEGETQLECEKVLLDSIQAWIDIYDVKIEDYSRGGPEMSNWIWNKRLLIIESLNRLS